MRQMMRQSLDFTLNPRTSSFTRLLGGALMIMLLASGSASAQMFTDFKPGGAVAKDGYTPDPKKGMQVIFWHHKKRTNEMGKQPYFMDADGVNNTTANEIKKLMVDRHPDFVFYVKETNERDYKALVERERVRIKFIEKDWVDVKPKEKPEPPKALGRAKFGYDENAEKKPGVPPANAEANDLTGTIWKVESSSSLLDGGDSLEFRKGGWVWCKMKSKTDAHLTRWKWSQNANSLTFDSKEHYSRTSWPRESYSGVISKSRIEGKFISKHDISTESQSTVIVLTR